ncbi:MAG: hypothetical protein QME51_03945 [Planctomycetota bacterium]|nr:hypothetical protein [Planctomycetota bacterium]
MGKKKKKALFYSTSFDDAYTLIKNLVTTGGYGFNADIMEVLEGQPNKPKIDAYIRGQAQILANAGGYYPGQLEKYAAQAFHDWALAYNPAEGGGVKGLKYLAQQVQSALNTGKITKKDFIVPTEAQIRSDVTDELIKQTRASILEDLTPGVVELLYSQNPAKFSGMTKEQIADTLIQTEVIPSAKWQQSVDENTAKFVAFEQDENTKLWQSLSTVAGEQRSVDWDKKKEEKSAARSRVYGPLRLAADIVLSILPIPGIQQAAQADLAVNIASLVKKDDTKVGEAGSWERIVETPPTAAAVAGTVGLIDYLTKPTVTAGTGDKSGVGFKNKPDGDNWEWNDELGVWTSISGGGGGGGGGDTGTGGTDASWWDNLKDTLGLSDKDTDANFWNTLKDTMATITAEKLLREKEERQLLAWYNQRTKDIRAELGRTEEIGRVGKTRTEEDYAKAMEALERSQHLQDVMTREQLAERGITPETKSSIGASEWGRVGAEQLAARTGTEQARTRRLEDIESGLTQARAEEEQALREAYQQKELRQPTWGNILESRISPEGLALAAEDLLRNESTKPYSLLKT